MRSRSNLPARARVRSQALSPSYAAAAIAALAALLALIAPASATAVTISPLRGSVDAMPGAQISFLGVRASALHSIRVVGSVSGRHSGVLRSYSSATGASFLPRAAFAPGETVTVTARARIGRRTRSLSTSFSVAQPATIPLTEFVAGPTKASEMQSFQSEPQLHPPVVTVHKAASPASAPGFLFATPFIGPGQYGPMIFDNSGGLVWFRPLPAGEDAADLRSQAYRGKTDLTWWQGKTYSFGFGAGVDVVANSNYRTVAVIKAGNGLQADEHEFLLTPQGSAFVLAYSPVMTNLTSAGGPASGIALDSVIQEIDPHTGLVMWEWHSLGHVDVSESYSKLPGLATNPFDYFHINSLDVDAHGNILISARNTWALYELNAHTGAVTWRLGGKKTTFVLAAGVAFAWQHNGLFLPNGDVSVFDDEGAPTIKGPSRGEVIKLNTSARTATLASQFVRSPVPLQTNSQGNLQALSGERWLVGWGGLPNFTEFNAKGEVIFDAQLPNATFASGIPAGEFSYRVYRLPWSGQPSAYAPAIAVRRTPCPPGAQCLVAESTAVYASWNGATGVASWQLLTGADAGHLTPTGATTPRTGFETTIPAPAAAFYQVRALSASGKVLATSRAAAAAQA
jgi:outer membrane protein assembly factor BamB